MSEEEENFAGNSLRDSDVPMVTCRAVRVRLSQSLMLALVVMTVLTTIAWALAFFQSPSINPDRMIPVLPVWWGEDRRVVFFADPNTFAYTYVYMLDPFKELTSVELKAWTPRNPRHVEYRRWGF